MRLLFVFFMLLLLTGAVHIDVHVEKPWKPLTDAKGYLRRSARTIAKNLATEGLKAAVDDALDSPHDEGIHVPPAEVVDNAAGTFPTIFYE